MKVLIVKTSSMGDVIHTFPAVEDARKARPDIVFDWCVEEAFVPIVALHPSVRTIHPVAIRRWRKLLLAKETRAEIGQLRRALRDARYDLVLDAQGLVKSALVAKLAGAPVAGFDRKSIREPLASLFYARRYKVSRSLHAIERTRRLIGLALGYEPDLATLGSGIAVPDAKQLLPTRFAFLLHGTSRDDKKWPVANWIETARLLAERGLMPMTTWSNAAEKRDAEAISAAEPETIVIPKSPLSEIAAVLGRSTAVIGADTGLTHLASAFGIPTVAIFVSTQPGLTGPRGAYAATLLGSPTRQVTASEALREADRLMGAQAAAG